MKYAFFGSPRFAEIILERLIAAGFSPSLVVCNPDRPVGKKQTITPPLTKKVAQKHGIPVWQPTSQELRDTHERIAKEAWDFFVVAAYAHIIPRNIVTLPRLGTIGVHPSLLPQYRGATPIQSVILAGETETGTTLYLMDEKMDHGNIIANVKCKIENENYTELQEKLAHLSADLLIKTIPQFIAGKITPQQQNHEQATFTKKFTIDDACVSPEDLVAAEQGDTEKAKKIDRMIRALNPEPGVWTIRDGIRTKLLEVRIEGNALKLTLVHKAGKKPEKI